MRDELEAPFLDDWLHETEVTPPDPREGARRVATRLPHAKQVGRWLPFPVLHRKVQTPTAAYTAEYQPSPSTATNGRAPTVIGRTHSMFSPVKAITAGALIFALGGMFLIAQPFDQGGSVPGAEQGADPAAPVEVTATHIGILGCTNPDSVEVDGPVERAYGFTCEVLDEWSDPRLEGTETYVDNSVEYMDESGLSIAHYVHDIVTDDGAWRMRPQFSFESAGPGDFSGTWVLDGEGAYEGLSAVLAKEGDDLHGFIVPTDHLPPAPERASTK